MKVLALLVRLALTLALRDRHRVTVCGTVAAVVNTWSSIQLNLCEHLKESVRRARMVNSSPLRLHARPTRHANPGQNARQANTWRRHHKTARASLTAMTGHQSFAQDSASGVRLDNSPMRGLGKANCRHSSNSASIRAAAKRSVNACSKRHRISGPKRKVHATHGVRETGSHR